uniref:Uncharacterized protein n=1 Tax=Desulfatirhabdium butyrativorans TaxID=340467 RepID=A0A7C4VRT3_9BACT
MGRSSSRILWKRRYTLALGLIAAALLSWWAQFYDPLTDRMREQEDAIAKLRFENERLEQRIDRLSAYVELPTDQIEQLRERQNLLISGRILEEVNPAIQTAIQEIADREGVSIKSYKDLPVGQWKDHFLARIEVQIETTTESLAKFLEALDNMQRLIQVEKMTVIYRKTRGFDLQVNIQVSALFPGR